MNIVTEALDKIRAGFEAEIQGMDLSQDERDAYDAGRAVGMLNLVIDLQMKFGNEKTVDVRRELMPFLSIVCADVADEMEGK